MTTKTIGVAAIFCVALTGCGETVSRPAFISDHAISPEVKAAGADDVLLYAFQQTASAAKAYSETRAGEGGEATATKAARLTALRRFMRSGFGLIYARCNSYILVKSDHQRNVNVWRDAIAPVTTLAVGLAGLVSKGGDVDDDILTAVSLTSNGVNAGFRIYEQRFLFGAENVNSVRELVLNALNSNSGEAMTTDDDQLDYTQAVIHLVNNQSICSPGHILQLVTAAIKEGKVESGKTGTTDAAAAGSGAAAQPGAADSAAKPDGQAVLDQLVTDKLLTQAQADAVRGRVKPAMPGTPPKPKPDVMQPQGFDTIMTRVQAKE